MRNRAPVPLSSVAITLRVSEPPLEQAAGEITASDLHVLITGEEAALPFQTALGDDAVVGVAGKEADGGLIRRHLVGANYAAPE